MARDVVSVDNMEIHKNRGNVMISVNPKIYPLDIIFSAAYIFIDKAYVIVDGDPDEEIIVLLKAKDKKIDLEKLGKEFNNELINYSFYAVQTNRSMPIRSAIVQRAFLTHAEEPIEEEPSTENVSYIGDSEKIAVPWEEKYGLEGEKIGKSISRRKKRRSKT